MKNFWNHISIRNDDSFLLISIKTMIFIDFLAVSLVIPLLPVYFKDSGVNSKEYGIIASIYFISQLFGGLIFGFLSDSISKNTILKLSFVGSFFSYFIVYLSNNFYVLLTSRIIVGLVKQTMTTSSLLITEIISDDEVKRSKELAQSSAISSITFVIGPPIGGVLYSFNDKLPCLIASFLFIVNLILCQLISPICTKIHQRRHMRFVGNSEKGKDKQAHIPTKNNNGENNDLYKVGGKLNKSKNRLNLFTLFEPKKLYHDLHLYDINLWFIMAIRFLVTFLQQSQSSKNIISYYEDRFDLETHHLGFLSSFSVIISVITEMFLVGYVIKNFATNELLLANIALFFLSFFSLFDSLSKSFIFHLLFSLIPVTILNKILSSVLYSRFINLTPSKHLGKMISIFNFFVNIVGITAPIYGSRVFDHFGGAHFKGYVTSFHYLIASLMCFAFIKLFPGPDIGKNHKTD